MALRVWLPLNGSLINNGCDSPTIVSSTPAYSDSGKIGKALSLASNGNATIKITWKPSAEQMSLAFWLNPNSPGIWTDVFSFGDNNRMEVANDAKTLYHWYANGNWLIGSIDLFTLNSSVWSHIAITADGTNVKFYVNGVLTKTTTQTDSLQNVFATNGFFYIGARIDNSSKYTGLINDFRIYDHCLSVKEIKEISKGLVIHYPLNDAYLEDATNLIDVQYKSSGGGGWGGHTSTWTEYDSTNDPIPCNKCTKMAITYSGSGGGGVGMSVKGITSGASITYCYSCYVKTPDALGPLNGNILYRYEYDSNNTKTTEAGCWTSSNYQALGNNWYRVWGTFTTTASTARFDVYSFVYPNKTCDYYIGCWQLEQKDRLTPYVFGSRSQRTLYDSSGYKNNATVSAGLETSTNTPRNTSSLGIGGNKYCSVTLQSNSGCANSYTFSWWARFSAVNNRMFWGFQNGNRLNLYMSDSNKFYWNTGDGVQNPFDSAPATTTYSDSKWHHFAVTGDGTTTKLYIDGVFRSNSKTYKGITGTILVLNGWDTGTSYKVNGYMSDYRLYSTVLTADDIKELYNTPANINRHSVMTQGEYVEK